MIEKACVRECSQHRGEINNAEKYEARSCKLLLVRPLSTAGRGPSQWMDPGERVGTSAPVGIVVVIGPAISSAAACILPLITRPILARFGRPPRSSLLKCLYYVLLIVQWFFQCYLYIFILFYNHASCKAFGEFEVELHEMPFNDTASELILTYSIVFC